MKPYRILKDFKGSQTGIDYHEFAAGTTADLSDDLAAVAVKEGWAQPTEGEVELVEAVYLDNTLVADFRETKVEAPAETKVVEAEEVKKPKKKGKA